MEEEKLPIYRKMNLSIREASEYSGIGETELRRLIAEQKANTFILFIGRKKLIKRKEFEEWNRQQFVIH